MVFVDTSFFFALASPGDPDHDRVREVFETFDRKRLPHLWLTTNHVVFETITLARKLDGHRAAIRIGARLYREVLARIHWATKDEETKAFDYLAKHKDKDYSPELRRHGGPRNPRGLDPRWRLPAPVHRPPRPEGVSSSGSETLFADLRVVENSRMGELSTTQEAT